MVELIITFMICRVGQGPRKMIVIPSKILLKKNHVRYCETFFGRFGLRPRSIVFSGLFVKIFSVQQLRISSLSVSKRYIKIPIWLVKDQ